MFKNLIIIIGFLYFLLFFNEINAKLCRFIYTVKHDDESCEDMRENLNITRKVFQQLNPEFNCTKIEVNFFLITVFY